MTATYSSPPATCPDCGGRRQPHKARCYHCALRHHEDQPAPLTPAPEPDYGPYRCRVHFTPVTWRGTGCLHCLDELAARRASPARRKEAS